MPKYSIEFEITANDKDAANEFIDKMGVGIKKLTQERYKENFLDDKHTTLLEDVEEINDKVAELNKSLRINRI
jgi:hypothetical protein|tara:strand:- start:988 stop:1206 length:219 start_codon:yes stop_codon:yes gene_type:complete